MKKIIYLFILISLFSLVYGETVTIYPSDDMYTDAVNQGTTQVNTELWTANYSATGQFQRIMIKFDLSQYENRELESAVLNLTRFLSCPSGGTTATTFYVINEAWDENTWAFNQSVSYDSENNMPYVFSGTGGNAVVHFDVEMTDFISHFITGNVVNNGFLIMANPNQKWSKFYSKEHSNVDYRPSLTLTFGETANNDEVLSVASIVANNYPNPFNPSTTIKYTINKASQVDIDIYNVKGQLVKSLYSGHKNSGDHTIVWDGFDLKGKASSAGVYFYKIQTENETIMKSMVMVK